MIEFIMNHTAWFWFILGVIFSLIEIFTMGLTTIWFAIGALVMIFISFTGINIWYQVLLFAIFSSALLFFTRPLVVKKLKIGKEKTNVDSIIGKKAVVTKAILPPEKGEVKIEGVIWTAKTESGKPLSEGTECTINSVSGVTVIVTSVSQSL
jgi:membrane protein implicated in regulation of membrane protease activity